MKNNHIGQCCICGKTCQLTKEHVPPHKAFNNFKSQGLTGDNFVNAIQNKKYKVKINQSGSYDYTLCAECNNHTGKWYAEDYVNFIRSIHSFCNDMPENATCLTLEANKIQMGNIIKEIFAMFASSLQYNRVTNLGIDKYLLEKDNFKIDTSKFKLYCYMNFDYMIEKTGVISAFKTDGSVITFASLKTYPLGFVLNLNPKISDKAWEQMLDLEDVIKAENNLIEKIALNIPIINNYQPAFNTKKLIEDIRNKSTNSN